MADTTAPASSDARLAEHETQLATHPSGDAAAAETAASDSTRAPAAASTSYPTTVAEAASTAGTMAASAASTAASAAVGVKDNVFSMFGGGPKKEAKPETEEFNDRSGSSKEKGKVAEKEAEGEQKDDEAVSLAVVVS